MSNCLAGVIFDPKLDGDDKPPCEQGGLSDEDRKAKEFAVFDKAINELDHYWTDATFDGFNVTTKKIICGEDNLEWNDYDHVKEYFKASVRDLHNFGDLAAEYKKMLLHIDRHLNEISFIRCKDRSCCNPWRSTEVQEYFKPLSYRLPAPVFSKYSDGHYDTFLQRMVDNVQQYGDYGQPTAMNASLGKCSFCPTYCFKSKTGKERHISMFHRRQKTTYVEANVDCVVCGKIFTSVASLNRHKNIAKHTTRETGIRKRSAPVVETNQPAKKRKTKPRTINDMLRQMSRSVVERTDEDDLCSADSCIIGSLKDPVITWLGCEKCKSWYHSVCVDLGDKSKVEIEELRYVCVKCVL